MRAAFEKLLPSILTLVALAGLASCSKADVVYIDPNSYAAVAFSKSTGKYGYAWNHYSRAAAEREALSKCTEKDAEIVGWVNDGFLVVAIADDNAYGMGYRWGDGASTRDAADTAIRNLAKHTTKPYKTLIVLCSGDVKPQLIKR